MAPGAVVSRPTVGLSLRFASATTATIRGTYRQVTIQMNRYYFARGSADHAAAQRFGNGLGLRMHLQLLVDAAHVPGRPRRGLHRSPRRPSSGYVRPRNRPSRRALCGVSLRSDFSGGRKSRNSSMTRGSRRRRHGRAARHGFLEAFKQPRRRRALQQVTASTGANGASKMRSSSSYTVSISAGSAA